MIIRIEEKSGLTIVVHLYCGLRSSSLLLEAYPHYDEFWEVCSIFQAGQYKHNCNSANLRITHSIFVEIPDAIQQKVVDCLEALFGRKYQKQGVFIARLKEHYESILSNCG